MEVRCYSSLEEAAFLRDPVNALNRAAPRPDPFSTFEFFENYLQHNEDHPQGQGMRLWFLAAFDSTGLAGYMALKQVMHKVMGFPAPKLDFLVVHNMDRPQLVARTGQAQAVSEAFYNYLLKHRREWSFLEFCQQDSASALFPPPGRVNLKACWVREWPSLDNGTITVSWDTLHSYFKSFSKKFRSNTSRQMRSLLAAGKLEYVTSSDPQSTLALFELYRHIEPRSWKSRADVAISRHPQWVDYYQGLLQAHQPMRLCIHVLLLDGVPIAGLITGAFQRGLYALHIVYDNSLSHLGPGSAMLLMGMRQAIDGGYAFFNLLSGFGYYKVRWQAQMKPARNAQIYRMGSPFFWHRILGDVKRWLVPASVQQGGWLFNPIRREVIEQDPELTDEVKPLPRLSPAEQQQINTLLAQGRRGRGEFLSSEQLAALMPFSTQRPAGKSTEPENEYPPTAFNKSFAAPAAMKAPP